MKKVGKTLPVIAMPSRVKITPEKRERYDTTALAFPQVVLDAYERRGIWRGLMGRSVHDVPALLPGS